MASSQDRVETLLALNLEEPKAGRAAFLDVVCDHDPDLRARLEALGVEIRDVITGKLLYTLPDEPGSIWWLACLNRSSSSRAWRLWSNGSRVPHCSN